MIDKYISQSRVSDKLSDEFQRQWKYCMEEQPILFRALRNIAGDILVLHGAEEVGSSDVNCKMYDLWRQHGQIVDYNLWFEINDYYKENA